MSDHRVFRHGLLIGLTSLWLILVLLPAYLAAQGWSVAAWLYFLFSRICHQIPERSFFWMGHQLAVCHRCWGIYIGFWLGLIAFPFLPAFSRELLKKTRLMLVLALPLLVDVFLDNTVLSRFVTGGLAGFPVALFVWTALQQMPISVWRLARRPYESDPAR